MKRNTLTDIETLSFIRNITKSMARYNIEMFTLMILTVIS